MDLGQHKLTIIDAVTMAANITSTTLDMEGKTECSIELHAASSTHVGTVAVQGSNSGSNWNAITLDSVPTAANGAAFDALVLLDNVSFRYLRVVYTASSGAGTLYAYAVAK